MIILGLDPGLKATGYAVVDAQPFVRDKPVHEGWAGMKALAGIVPAPRLVDCGRFTPSPTRGAASQRIASITSQVVELIEIWISHGKCAGAVLELPSKHVNPYRHGGGGSGLANYGWLCGALWRDLSLDVDVALTEVSADEWLRGAWQRQKDRRLIAVHHFPKYDAAQDLGGDAADACCLILWALKFGRLIIGEA